MATETGKAASQSLAQDARGRGEAGKPAKGQLRLFISYSRKNIGVVKPIAADLTAAGFDVKIDTEAIEYGEQWLKQLDNLILNCDTVVFFTAFESIKSPICDWELEKADAYGKRVFPVLIEAVPPEQLPARLAKQQLFPSPQQSDGNQKAVYDRTAHLPVLVEALHKDVPWLMEGTRLADRAHQWIEKGRSTGLLLSAAALKDADTWVSHRPPKGPAASREVLGFIDASRKRASQRQRWAIMGALTIAVVAGALALAALVQRQAALTQRDETAISRSKALEEVAFRAIESGDAATGLLLALSGVPDGEEGKGRRDLAETENMLLSGILNLHEKRIFDGSEIAALSRDGSRVAYAKSPTEIQVADVVTGKELVALKHPADVNQVTFSPNGQHLLTEGDGALRIWSLQTGHEILTLKNATGFGSTTFSADGARLLLSNGSKASDDTHGVMVWDLVKQQRDLLLTHPKPVTLAAFSPDGKWIVTVADDDKVRVFDAQSGRPQTTITAKPGRVAFTPDGAQVVTIRQEGRTSVVEFWQIADGTAMRTLKLASGSDSDANLSRDGKRIVTNDSTANVVKIWNIENPNFDAQEELSFKAQMENLTRGVAYGGVTADFDSSGTAVVSSHRDNTVRVWDLRYYPSKEIETGCESGMAHLLASRDGSLLVTHCDKDWAVKLWDGATGQLRRSIGRKGIENVEVLLSNDASTLISLGKDGTIVTLAVPVGREAVSSHGSEIISAAMDGAGTTLATGGKDGSIRIWKRKSATSPEWASSPVIASVPKFEIARLAFSPDGGRVLSLYGDRSARIWDAGSGKLLVTMTPANLDNSNSARDDGTYDSFLAACAFSPDGRYVATEKGGFTYIWDAASGAQLSATQTTYGTPIMKLAFSKDSQRLMSGGIEWQTWIGDVRSGRKVRYVDTATYDEYAYLADGELIATSDYGGLQLNDAVTGRPIAILPGTKFDKVALSDDGSRAFAAGREGGAVYVWTLPRPGAERVKLARQLVPRCLTTLQLRDAGLDPIPPRWCITGPDHVADQDPATWDGKWPYRTSEWRAWLGARQRGENPTPPVDTRGDPPPLKPTQAPGTAETAAQTGQ